MLSSFAIGADQVPSPPTYCHSDGSLPTPVDNLATLHTSILMTEAALFPERRQLRHCANAQEEDQQQQEVA
jgi:hypothetical protein